MPEYTYQEDRRNTHGGKIRVYETFDNGYDFDANMRVIDHPFVTAWWYIRGLYSNFAGVVKRDFTPEQLEVGLKKDEYLAASRDHTLKKMHGEAAEPPVWDESLDYPELSPGEWRWTTRGFADSVRRRYPVSWRKALTCYATRENLYVFPEAPLRWGHQMALEEDGDAVQWCLCDGEKPSCHFCHGTGLALIPVHLPEGTGHRG